MTRRDQGSGSIRAGKRTGTFELRYRGKSKVVEADNRKGANDELKDWIVELDAVAGRGGTITMGRLFEDYLADHLAHGMAETSIVEKKIAKHLKPRFEYLDAHVFGKRELKTYIAERKKEGAANGTINRELSIIRRSLKLAAEELQRIVIIQPLPEGKKRTGTITEDEYRWLLMKLPDWAQPVLVIAYFTGMRRGAILELRWAWYDAESELIIIPEGVEKNDEQRPVPLIGDMRAMLHMLLAVRNPKCPFIIQRGGKSVTIHQFNNVWTKARDAYKAYQIGNGTAEEEVKHIRFHDNRRTAVTNAVVEHGLNLEEAMVLSGHKDRQVAADYMILAKQNAAKVRDKLNASIAARRLERSGSKDNYWDISGTADEPGSNPAVPSTPPKFKQ